MSSASEIRPGRRKVALAPGHSQLDWMRLTQQQPSLTGLAGRPPRLTMEEVQRHNSLDDAWMVIRGKVYNLTPYFSYHPGGVEELMRGAGSDGTALFEEVHRWVNVEYILAKAYIGELLPPEPVAAPVLASGGSSSGVVVMPIDVWTGCTVESVSAANEKGDMITVRVQLPPGMVLGWDKPVEHVDVMFSEPLEETEIMRTFTPITSLAETSHFELLVHVYPLGRMSNYLRTRVNGDVINVRPKRSFVHFSPALVQWSTHVVKPDRLVLFAAGSGVTPMIQIMRSIADSSPPYLPVHLILSLKSLSQLPNVGLAALCDKIGAKMHVFITGEPVEASPPGVFAGRISPGTIGPLLPPPTEHTLVAWSGPEGWPKAVDGVCRSLYYLASNLIAFDV